MRINSRTLVEVLAALAVIHVAFVAWAYALYIPGIEQATVELNSVDIERMGAEKLRDFAISLMQNNARILATAMVVYLTIFGLLFGLALRAMKNAPATTPEK